jgi:hypothetical protein
MGFQLSPGVDIKETDLSVTIPSVATSYGVMVGVFEQGPCNKRTKITSENELVRYFGRASNYNDASFFTAANFLQYGNNLNIVRVTATDAKNATDGTGAVVMIKNDTDWEDQKAALPNAIYAKHPGAYYNDVTVSYANESEFVGWKYENLFEAAPDLANHEVCVVVSFDGAPVETYTVSLDAAGKDSEGNNIYIEEVMARQSSYVYMIAANMTESDADADPTDANDDYTLAGGTDGAARPTAAQWIEGWELFEDPEQVEANLVLAGAAAGEDVGLASDVQRYAIQNLAEARKDCVAFVSPPKSIIVGRSATDATNELRTWRTGTGSHTTNHMNVNSSYGFIDGNYKYQYDRYNDVYRWVPFAGDIAGLCVITDAQKDAWWSPGGLNRGKIKGVVKLAFNPSKAHRDDLYKAPYNINPIISMPGRGTVLWGDKTALTKPSAFDRINVRRLFIVLETAIARSSQYTLFEFNDEYTRAAFKGMVEPFMKSVKGRRGVYDYKVICDESNNTSDVIDRNEFVANIFIKPARSINYITLNFVATRSGVQFEELFGSV